MVNNDQEINAQTFKNKLLGVEENQRKLLIILKTITRE